nr:PREDICTED: uncharacterized protein LOC104961717 [Notothenia coriiceps]
MMTGFRLNLSPLKEPLGFVKLVEWLTAIFAFGSCSGFSGKNIMSLFCGDGRNDTLDANFHYPFRLSAVPLIEGNATLCNQSATTTHMVGDSASSVEFFVGVAIVCFLYSMVALLVYLGYMHVYKDSDFGPIFSLTANLILVQKSEKRGKQIDDPGATRESGSEIRRLGIRVQDATDENSKISFKSPTLQGGLTRHGMMTALTTGVFRRPRGPLTEAPSIVRLYHVDSASNRKRTQDSRPRFQKGQVQQNGQTGGCPPEGNISRYLCTSSAGSVTGSGLGHVAPLTGRIRLSILRAELKNRWADTLHLRQLSLTPPDVYASSCSEMWTEH